jgi:hypothetical protein
MTKVRHRDSCRQLLKNWGILPFYSQYIFYLIMFVVRSMYLFTTNQEINGVNTRQNTYLYLISVRLAGFKEGACLTEMRIFNHLATNIKQLANRAI